MGLFSKKPPCPICGGKVSWLLPTKIEGEAICDDCSGKIDMQEDLKDELTMQQLKEYLAFYEQNQALKEKFVISEKIDFGLLDTKIIFDYVNRLFCMSKKPDKTIFEGAQLRSFTIKEDDYLLVEGSAAGIVRYPSTVREQAVALAPQLAQYVANRRMMERMERAGRDDDDDSYHHIPTMDIPEPFGAFNLELQFDHPYWRVLQADMSGPTFSSTDPDVNDYLDEYQESMAVIEQLVNALTSVAFPNAPQQLVGAGGAAQPAPPDASEELRKFKALMEDGVITAEEFAAKKKQLLGI